MSKMYLNEEQEKELNYVDRLGLAYCQLNSWEWDDAVGSKPEGFDELPRYDNRKFKRIRKKIKTKDDYLTPAIKRIELIIGRANMSRCWWKFELEKTEEEWKEWYITMGERMDEYSHSGR